MMDKLKAFRKRHKLTQADIYNALGYKRRIWEKYERGEREIPQHVFIAIDNYTKLNK